MHRNYFIYALDYGGDALVPVVLEVQELATDEQSGEILGAFGVGYSTDHPTGECVVSPGYLLNCPIDAQLAEVLIHHIRKRHGCFVPHALFERLPRLAMPINGRHIAAGVSLAG